MWFRTIPLIVLSLTITASAYAFAGPNPERFQLNHDIRIGPDDNPGDVTCINCSVYVRGHVAGHIFTLNGNIVFKPEAQNGCDLVTLGVDVRLERVTQVRGDIHAHRAEGQ